MTAAAFAPASLHTDILPVNQRAGGARDGARARDLQGSGLVERRRARIRPSRCRPGRARDPPEEAVEERAGSRTWPGKEPLPRGQGERGVGFLGDAELEWQSEITTGRACERTRGGRGAGEARAPGRGYSPGRWRWQGVSPARGGWARGGERGFRAGMGVGATTTAPLSRDEARVLLSRCAPPGSRCAPNFKTLSVCWRRVSVNLGTSSMAFWLCVPAFCSFVLSCYRGKGKQT